MKPERDPDVETADQTPPAVQGPLEGLMAAGDVPRDRPQPGPARDVEAEALAAARALVDRAVEAAAAGPPAPGAARREWILRALLVLNLALLGAMLALPTSAPPARPAAPTEPERETAAPPAPQTSPPRLRGLNLEDQPRYVRALELAGKGEYDAAIRTLEEYVAENPHMAEVEQRLALQAMAMFAVRAGRVDEATKFERRIDALRTQAHLPEDLLQAARLAEAEGRGADMRRYYARFLLQQRQVPPSLRAQIAEAYLKLGDGYRIEAEKGAERAAAEERERAQSMRSAAEKARGAGATEPAGKERR
jgi:hypothetical protein